MTEDQLLNLRAGDIIHKSIPKYQYCQKWTIDYKIDKYKAHGVLFLEDHHYLTTWFDHKDLSRLHLPEECPHNQESQD